VRPTCRSCLRSDLTCQYELPAGQTRIQASSENQQRLQNQIRVYKSLIRSLQQADSRSSHHILENLRCGHYNEVLSLDDDTCRTETPRNRIHPWEDQFVRDEQCRKHPAEVLPSIRTLLHLQDNDSMLPYPRSIHDDPTFSPREIRPSKHSQSSVTSGEDDCSRSQQTPMNTDNPPRRRMTAKRLRLED
jgi:hypothetical protein